jgi:hypothetical protein
MVGQRDRREEDVSDDGAIVLGDEGDDFWHLAECIDKVDLEVCLEGGLGDMMHAKPVGRLFRSDQHVNLSNQLEPFRTYSNLFEPGVPVVR